MLNQTGTPLESYTPATGRDPNMPVPRPVPEGDPLDPQMLSWDSAWTSLFAWPQYHPDLLYLHRGWEEIDGMLTNAIYQSALRIKKYATLYKGLTVEGAVDDPKDPQYERSERIKDFCEWCLNHIGNPDTGDVMSWRVLLWAIMDAYHAGFSVIEKVYRPVAAADTGLNDPDLPPVCLAFETFAPKRPRQIGFQLDPYTLRIVNVTALSWAYAGLQVISPKRLIIYTYQPTNGLPYGLGDARGCWKHVGALTQLTRWWGLALEYNGIPRPKATTTNPDRTYQTRLRQIMDTWRQGAPMVIPPDVVIEILDNSSNQEAFRAALKYHEEQIWTNVLGQTLTTMQGVGPGSYALGAVHENTREYFFKFVRDDIEEIVTEQVLRPLVALNYGESVAATLTPKACLGNWDNDERNLMAQFYETLIASRIVSPDEPFVRSDLGIQPGTPTVSAFPDAQMPPGQPQNPGQGRYSPAS